MIPTGSNLQGSNMQRDRSISRSSSSSSDKNRNTGMIGQTGHIDTIGNTGLTGPGFVTGNIQSGYGQPGYGQTGYDQTGLYGQSNYVGSNQYGQTSSILGKNLYG